MLHEFAHFSKGHTRMSLAVYRQSRLVFHLADELEELAWRWLNPLHYLVKVFAWCFQRMYAAISRAHERQSDLMAVHVLGRSRMWRR